jgi:molybdopterin converting factor small subunit
MDVELPDGATVGQLVQHLGLPADHVRVAFVNGIARDDSHPLADGDEVGLFPPVGGG